MSVIRSERLSFLGSRMPSNIKLMRESTFKVEIATQRAILQVVVAALSGKEIDENLASSISNGSEEFIANVNIIISGLYTLMKAVLRLPEFVLKREVFVDDIRELNLPDEFAAEVTEVLYGPKRGPLENLKNRPHLPSLMSLRWRVDISISTSALNRVLEPTIVMELALDNGDKKTIEVSIKSFHQLRFNVAKVLKEMDALQKKTIMRIKD